MIEVRNLDIDHITSDMFSNFNRHQVITKKWIRSNNQWVLSDAKEIVGTFVDSEDDRYLELVLKRE